MKKLFSLQQYILHWFKSVNQHGIHSPFVYELYTDVLRDTKQYYCFKEIEQIRKKLLSDSRNIDIPDYGAGSNVIGNSSVRVVGDIAKTSLKPAAQAQMLFRLMNYLSPETSLEIGTSLGITTSYLASVSTQNKVYSLEGVPSLCKIAAQNLSDLGLKNTEIIEGKFASSLPNLLNRLNTIDFVFIDGNHRKEPTLEMLKAIKPKLSLHACVVVDDIYWSREMREAWLELKSDSQFEVSIDLYFFGILIKKPGQVKEHFCLKPGI